MVGLVVSRIDFTRPDQHTKKVKVDNPLQFYTYVLLRVIMTFIFTFFGFLFFYTTNRGLDVTEFAIVSPGFSQPCWIVRSSEIELLDFALMIA